MLVAIGPKAQRVVRAIEALVAQGQPGDRLPSMRSLMEDLEVSLVTLNSAIADLERRGLIERRRGSGLYIRPSIGLRACLIADPRMFIIFGTSPFYGLFLSSVYQEAQRQGIGLTVCFNKLIEFIEGETDPRESFEESLLLDIRSGLFQGALTLGMSGNQARFLESLGLPSVAFGGSGTAEVYFREEELIEEGVAYLAKEGCRSIDYWTYEGPSAAMFLEACRRQKVKGKTSCIPDAPLGDAFSHEPQSALGFRHAMARLSTSDRPEGLLLMDDAYTQGVLMALNRMDIEVGRDIKVATHSIAGSPVLWGWEPKLFRMEVDPAHLAAQMVSCLMAELGRQTLAAQDKSTKVSHHRRHDAPPLPIQE